jgi:hypothetical protein
MAVDPRNVGSAADIYSIGRLAAWGTSLNRGEARSTDSGFARWWRLLIDGTTRYEPQERWGITDVLTHLRSRPISVAAELEQLTRERAPNAPVRIRRGEPCPHCGSEIGRDASERCLRCHMLLPY